MRDKLDIVTAVDEYVFGYCLQIATTRRRRADDDDDMVGYVSVLLETGAYPHLQTLTDQFGLRHLWREVGAAMRAEERFERNLGRLLDGIAHSLPATPPR